MTGSTLSAEQVETALEQVAQFGVASTRTADVLDVGTDAFLSHFESEILEEFLLRGGATCRLYEAVYGAGKSHLLDLLGTMGRRRGMVVCRIDLSQALDLREWNQVARHILENMTLEHDGQEHRAIPNIMEVLGRDAEESLVSGTSQARHAGFAEALKVAFKGAYGTAEGRSLIHRYLMGEAISAKRLREQGIHGVKDPLSRRNAEAVLETCINTLHRVSGQGVMLLFDENEQTLQSRRSVPTRREQSAANLIRRLIDACTTGRIEGAVVVFAVLPGFIERCSQAYQALGQRISRSGVDRENPSWRWPIVDLGAVNAFGNSEEFARAACAKLVRLVDHCGGNTTDLERVLRENAEAVLMENAGAEYRRPLMKRLAILALERIENG